jgi:chromosome segregation ATPase
MAEELNETHSDELELAQKILELTTYFQQNSTAIERIEASITSWESKIQDLDLQIASKFTELTNKVDENLNTFQNQLDSQIQDHNNLKENVQEQEEKIGLQAQEMKEKFEHQDQKVEEKFTLIAEHIDKITNEQKTTISALAEHVRSQLESLIKTDEIINESVNDINQLTNSHVKELEEVRKGLNDFKLKLQDLISISKKDQQTHFENFSRMIESLNENIRTEITLAMQTLKESDIEILNEISEHYMRKKAGEEIQKSVTNFYEEIQAQTTRSNEDFTENMKNSMMEYEKIIEEQSTGIQSYKEELDRIQVEIQDVIDRKVNEKYEAVFSLLATVTLHAEELMMLIKTAEIFVPREPGKKIGENVQRNSDQEKSEEEFQ